MLEYWNNGMAPFGQILAPLRSAIGKLEDWKFFKRIREYGDRRKFDKKLLSKVCETFGNVDNLV